MAMAYSELIKNFEKIRSYMREFYVYGFKSRSEYDGKSARSYDDERRRIESWLGDYMGFTQTPEGKTVFLSVDSRAVQHNPFYKAWKAKSFTDGDITLHFIIFDILYEPAVRKTLREILDAVSSDYLSCFEEPLNFDESTVRKKLKEYEEEGIIITEREGRQVYYRRAESFEAARIQDVLDFYSEVAPCGVVGSFLLDQTKTDADVFYFKHHYITQTVDSDVVAELFGAMHRKCRVTAENSGKSEDEPKSLMLVPLRIYVSVQNGRQYLLAYRENLDRIKTYRIDNLSKVKVCEMCEEYDDLRQKLDAKAEHIWGVNMRHGGERLEHVEFVVRFGPGEEYIQRRLEREKRCGTVERIDDTHCRFSADVYDTSEMVPWIRTFICRITQLNFTDRTLENSFKADIDEMYRLYGIERSDGQ